MDAQQLEAFLANVLVTECEETVVELDGLTVVEIYESQV